MNAGGIDIHAGYWVPNQKRYRDVASDQNDIKFTFPSIQKGEVILVPRKQKPSRDLFFFTHVFSRSVWGVIVAVLLLTTFIRFLIEWFESSINRVNSKDEIEMEFHLFSSAFFTWFGDSRDENNRYFTFQESIK